VPTPQVSPFDHLLFGARVLALHQGTSVRTEPLSGNDGRSADGARHESPPIVIVLAPVYGRPHPQSPIEQRLSRMISTDTELAPKFTFNTRVEDVRGQWPKVDLLWAEGRVVIEFDGPEHRARRAFRDDRHRDYELLCAGYLVLRIANDEIEEDYPRTIEKIRDVVRLRRHSGEGDER
jgi:very-short-patch-repair endonuclease